MKQQKCIRCKRVLPLDAFNKNVRKRSRHDNTCRQCRRQMYLKAKGSAHRYFPGENSDAELLSECKRRGLLPVGESSEEDVELTEALSAEFLRFMMWKANAENGVNPIDFFRKT